MPNLEGESPFDSQCVLNKKLIPSRPVESGRNILGSGEIPTCGRPINRIIFRLKNGNPFAQVAGVGESAAADSERNGSSSGPPVSRTRPDNGGFGSRGEPVNKLLDLSNDCRPQIGGQRVPHDPALEGDGQRGSRNP